MTFLNCATKFPSFLLGNVAVWTVTQIKKVSEMHVASIFRIFQAPPKCWYPYISLQRTISQKPGLFLTPPSASQISHHHASFCVIILSRLISVPCLIKLNAFYNVCYYLEFLVCACAITHHESKMTARNSLIQQLTALLCPVQQC